MAGEADKDVTLLYKEAQPFWASRCLDEMDDERFAAYVSALSEKVQPCAVTLPSTSVMAGDLNTQAYLLIPRDDAYGGGGEEAASPDEDPSSAEHAVAAEGSAAAAGPAGAAGATEIGGPADTEDIAAAELGAGTANAGGPAGAEGTASVAAAELGLFPFELPEGRYAEIELFSDEDIALVYKRLLDDIALLGCIPGEYFVEFFPCDDESPQRSSTLISVEIIMP